MWILWMKIALSWYVWHHRLRTSCRLSSAAYKESLINYTLHNGAVAVWLVHVTQEITKKDMELFICINYAVGNRGIKKDTKTWHSFKRFIPSLLKNCILLIVTSVECLTFAVWSLMEKRLFLTFICWRWESRKVSLSSHLKSRCKVSTYKPIGVQCAACFSLIWKFGASSAQTMRVDFSSTRLFFFIKLQQ